MTEIISLAAYERDTDKMPVVIPLKERPYAALLTPRQVGDRYGLSRKAIMGLIGRGTLPAIRDGGRYKVRADEAEQVLGEKERSRPSQEAAAPEPEAADALRKENLALLALMHKSEEVAMSAKNDARILAEAIERGCTNLPQVKRVVDRIRRQEHGS